ncbi:MAG: hypothetical protein KY468_12300 [Armatimonadetes bacterium]|nr:hypothetical protein [Armatimonadota bacterium]
MSGKRFVHDPSRYPADWNPDRYADVRAEMEGRERERRARERAERLRQIEREAMQHPEGDERPAGND